MRVRFINGVGIFFVVIVIVGFFTGLSVFAARLNSPPIPMKPSGLCSLEVAENRDLDELLFEIRPRRTSVKDNTQPPVDPDAPRPEGTRLYNNLLDNLLSGLHYYYRVPDDTAASKFVVSWNASDGSRVISNARLLSLQYNISYLLTIEMYQRIHTKAAFDTDLEFARKRVEGIFAEEWHTLLDWPLDPYFDLIELYELTGDDQYLQWAEIYAIGDGPQDTNTPLVKAKSLAFKFQFGLARVASPIYFYYAALLADWGTRNDPALLTQSRFLFEGLEDMLYDSRYKMLWKQATVQQEGSTVSNIIQTFDTLEQLSAINAIIKYGVESGDPNAESLARAVLDGVWGSNSPLLIPAPPPFSESTFYGLYTAYDLDRQAKRLDPAEKTAVQILLYETNVSVNEQTRGEIRNDVDYLAGWLDTSGPIYIREANGYFNLYNDNWEKPEDPFVSAYASIWMAKAIASDEWYRYRMAQAITTIGTSY